MEANRPPNRDRRVLLVCGAFTPEPCGVGDYTARLAAQLARDGVDVHVLTSRRGEGQDPFRVHALVEDWSDALTVRRICLDVVERIRPDVAQIQYPGSYGTANRALAGNFLPRWIRSRGVKVCTTLHEWGERKLQWRVRAGFMALSSDAVVAVTSHDARILSGLPLIGRRSVRHIPLGPSLSFEHEVPEDPIPVLAYFGFLDPLKGVKELLDAATLLSGRGVPFVLDLHGHFDPDRNAHHAWVRAYVDKSGLVSKVRFRGPVPGDSEGAKRAFESAVLGVFPFREGVSERRSSFIALGQAGIPILTTPGPWQPDWLRDGRNVFLEPLTPSGWAERIELILQDRSSLGVLGGRLKEEIVRRHSWPEVAKEHMSLWSEIA